MHTPRACRRSRAGLSRENLYKPLGENGNPSLATVLKIRKALGGQAPC
ncbi:MAG: DNA-binding protein [Thiobacillus sp.]